MVRNPWNVVGRYGWVGRTDTSGDVVPSDNCNAVLLTPGQTRSPPAVPPFRNRSGRQPSLATTPEAAGPIVSPKRQRLGPERQTTRGKRLGLADRQHRADLDIPAGSGTGWRPDTRWRSFPIAARLADARWGRVCLVGTRHVWRSPRDKQDDLDAVVDRLLDPKTLFDRPRRWVPPLDCVRSLLFHHGTQPALGQSNGATQP